MSIHDQKVYNICLDAKNTGIVPWMKNHDLKLEILNEIWYYRFSIIFSCASNYVHNYLIYLIFLGSVERQLMQVDWKIPDLNQSIGRFL